jgi:hypothetical protein
LLADSAPRAIPLSRRVSSREETGRYSEEQTRAGVLVTQGRFGPAVTEATAAQDAQSDGAKQAAGCAWTCLRRKKRPLPSSCSLRRRAGITELRQVLD